MWQIQRKGDDTDVKSQADTWLTNTFWEVENRVPGLSSDREMYGTQIKDLARESGLLKEYYNVAMETKLRQDPNAFLEEAEKDWKNRLLKVARVAFERFVEARASGLPDADSKALMRQTAEALTQVERTFHQLEWGADKLREADRIAKAKIAFKGDTGPPAITGGNGGETKGKTKLPGTTTTTTTETTTKK